MKSVILGACCPALVAGSAFALPAAVFFLVIQRYLVSGLTSGAVKG